MAGCMNPSQAESNSMAAYLERILGDWVTFVMNLEKQMQDKVNSVSGSNKQITKYRGQ